VSGFTLLQVNLGKTLRRSVSPNTIPPVIIRAALSTSPMGVGTPGCLQQVKPPGAGFFRFRGDHCWGVQQAQPRGVDHAVPPVVVRDALSSSPMGVGTPGCALASRGAQSECRWAQA
jgi:hypothetical protein